MANPEKKDLCWAKRPHSLHVTIWRDPEKLPAAVLLYYHGGGLVYGSRSDLPAFHLERLCAAGFAVLSFDYRLAPAAKLPDILEDVEQSVFWFLGHREQLFGAPLPYFLWGRSAGAYLCLLAGLQEYPEKPAGVLSYYGYAFLENFWYNHPNGYYLHLPAVAALPDSEIFENRAAASLEERFSLYVYARQTGNWLPLFFEGKEKELLTRYSFRQPYDFSRYPPVFLAHSFHDPDVPFAESKALERLLGGELFSAPARVHDFDRNVEEAVVKRLLDATVTFLCRACENRVPAACGMVRKAADLT